MEHKSIIVLYNYYRYSFKTIEDYIDNDFLSFEEFRNIIIKSKHYNGIKWLQ